MATIIDLQTRLAAYKAAELKILDKGQAYSLHSYSKDFGNLETIQKTIASIESQITTKTNNASDTGNHHTVIFGSPTT